MKVWQNFLENNRSIAGCAIYWKSRSIVDRNPFVPLFLGAFAPWREKKDWTSRVACATCLHTQNLCFEFWSFLFWIYLVSYKWNWAQNGNKIRRQNSLGRRHKFGRLGGNFAVWGPELFWRRNLFGSGSTGLGFRYSDLGFSSWSSPIENPLIPFHSYTLLLLRLYNWARLHFWLKFALFFGCCFDVTGYQQRR